MTQVVSAPTTQTIDILLPSDKEWRMKNYYRLVEKQRALASSPMPDVLPEKPRLNVWDSTLSTQPQAKRPRHSSASLRTDLSLTSEEHGDYSRTIFDIAKAGCLLAHPPLPVAFKDEEEMRRIYSLIYDVFRYKSVLNQALLNISFFIQYPQFNKSANLVWLLFYDLYKRRFLPRDSQDEERRKELFDDTGLSYIEEQLWSLRVKLAAALARLRIKNNALKLTQLLPPHLRDDHIIALEESFVTAWINTFKIRSEDVKTLIEKQGVRLLDEEIEDNLVKDAYKFDHLCPKFIMCHPLQRSELAQSSLVKRHQIILQDRAFCLGPAVICRALNDLDLTGSVVQTHINSPRTTAYLASMIAENPKIEGLVAFGAGNRKEEYEDYLRELGVNNTKIVADRFVEISPNSDLLNGVSAILASPPNTYSGVLDPVELVCSRGGDLNMLEVLTETEIGSDFKQRVKNILEEQRQTLRLSMSRPQIQMVLYETHSIVTAENGDMVTKLVNEMNLNARDRHIEELSKMSMTPQQSQHPQSARREGEVLSPTQETEQLTDVKGEEVDYEEIEEREITGDMIDKFKNVEIPPCDLFEVGFLPDLCPHGDKCLSPEEDGCFLALLRRKEIVRLNAKYMINIAESRGLFGGEMKKSSSGRSHKRREMTSTRSGSGGSVGQKQQTRRCKLEMNRITAPTQASMLRASFIKATAGEIFDEGVIVCQRHQQHTQQAYKSESNSHTRKGNTMLKKPRARSPRGSFTLAEQNALVRRLTEPARRKTFDDMKVDELSSLSLPSKTVSPESNPVNMSIVNLTYSKSDLKVQIPSSNETPEVTQESKPNKSKESSVQSPAKTRISFKEKLLLATKNIAIDNVQKLPQENSTMHAMPRVKVRKRSVSGEIVHIQPIASKTVENEVRRKTGRDNKVNKMFLNDDYWLEDYERDIATNEMPTLRELAEKKRPSWTVAKLSDAVAPLVEIVKGKMSSPRAKRTKTEPPPSYAGSAPPSSPPHSVTENVETTVTPLSIPNKSVMSMTDLSDLFESRASSEVETNRVNYESASVERPSNTPPVRESFEPSIWKISDSKSTVSSKKSHVTGKQSMGQFSHIISRKSEKKSTSKKQEDTPKVSHGSSFCKKADDKKDRLYTPTPLVIEFKNYMDYRQLPTPSPKKLQNYDEWK